jgi:very-short-patch-repair endonuclease
MALYRATMLNAVGQGEIEMFDWLKACGLSVIQQYPIEGYNLDIAVDGVLDVEIFNERCHPLAHYIDRRRRKHLLDLGWHILYVWTTKSHPIRERAADYVVSYLQEIRTNPPSPCQHRVIRGTGELALTNGRQPYNWPLVPAPEGYFDSIEEY